MKDIKRILVAITILVIYTFVLSCFTSQNLINGANEKIRLVINGDIIAYNTAPYVKDDGVYIPFDVIKENIDENIFYDAIANSVIVTTYDKLVKFKIGDTKKSVNLEYVECKYSAEKNGDVVYVPINELEDIYNIDIKYEANANVISIDKRGYKEHNVIKNGTKVYKDIKTGSTVLTTVNKKDKVVVYYDNFKHARWYKIRTSSGVVGYVSKNNIDFIEVNSEENNESSNNEGKEKITMFWQQGSNLTTMGKTKIEGVNVVSPDYFSLKDASGNIDSMLNNSYIKQAKDLGYKIWPMFTNNFTVSSVKATTSAMVNSEYNREQTIKNIMSLVEEYDLDGINIDFESMKEEDKSLFTQFIRELAPMLRSKNKTLSVDIYFVNYIERRRIGQAADYVILMGYDQHWGGSTISGSVSEVSWVEKNIQALLRDSEIPGEKIILGVPFYTRLWKEVDGAEKPTSVVYSMSDAKEFVTSNNLAEVWDEKAGQNYVEMQKGATRYKLWLEDATSVKKRVDLINKYSLAGISAWKKGLETSDIWGVINENMK